MKNQKGFTLIELLVVIAIIALLSTLAVISLGNIREKSRDTKRLSDMSSLGTAMELVNSEYGSYSVDLGCTSGGLVSSCTGGRLEEFLTTVRSMQDPLSEVNCVTNSCLASCDYAVRSMEENDYMIYFYLENGAGQFDEPGCYTLTPKGIAKE